MSVLLLRTITRKSIIGFGNYKDLTVQNLLDMYRAKELLHIYYSCRNIDFNQDLKDELCIYGEREINKKDKTDKKEDRYADNLWLHVNNCLSEMLNKKNDEEIEQGNGMLRKIKYTYKKNQKNRESAQNRNVFSKGAMQRKNQGKY